MADSKSDYLLRKQEELQRLNERLEREFNQQELELEMPKQRSYDQPSPRAQEEEDQEAEYSPPQQEEDFQEEQPQDDEALVMAQDLGELREQLSEAQSIIKIQKARIQALQDEMNDVLSQNNAQALELQRLKGSHQEATEETKKQSAQMTQISQNFEKMKKQLQEAQKRTQEQEKTIGDLNKEVSVLKTKQRREDQEGKSKEARLNRLAEEVEKYKSQLRDIRSQGGEDSDKSRREIERLGQENKRLEKQKNELLAAFKKQLKLIDILKRQKIHLEGARMLQFTEEEFMKTLEMGDRI